MSDEGREGIVSERKKCPVDRGKVLIALECCREERCNHCPYRDFQCVKQAEDVLAYIGWLEEQLEGMKNAKTD